MIVLLRWSGYVVGGVNVLSAFVSADRGRVLMPFFLLAVGLFVIDAARRFR